ncbi:hypothetical protein F7P74_09075 [Helicobacter pullorum NCTC 12824]|uniref:hypothetical protein n=1 Tax=Campylobacterales TaxID=213849 RepID=UPI0006BB39D2|nr:hypothetical protein [Helicobacter pullorum]KAB0573869.1 hypothetical protein F7P74_09075 [Helicobacter pullorum NCTC 12824]
MKKLSIIFILFISLGYAQEAKLTQVYFDENLTNLQCVKIFVNLVRSSNFNFKAWSEDKSVEWVKEHISFEFDTWDKHTILARLFFDWQDSGGDEFQGTGTIGFVKYDRGTQQLQDSILETPLRFDTSLAKKLESCE